MATVAEVLAQGWQLHQAGDLAGARVRYEAVAQQHPQNANAWCYLGILHFDLKQFEQSEQCYRRALQLQEEFPVAWSNMANTLSALDRDEEAIQCCQRALQQKPDYVTAMNNLGAVYVKQGRFGEAAEQLRAAVDANPQNQDAHRNLGAALVRQGELHEAQQHSQQAIAINPRDADAHKNLGIVHLLTGDFERGWQEYEWRWQTDELRLPESSQPVWDGSPLEGRTILLCAEQGLGDTIQFVRYALILEQQGARVIVQCQQPLTELLRSAPGVAQLVARGTPLPEFDVLCPMLSVPRLVGLKGVEDIPAGEPYLRAEPERVEAWRRRLDPQRFHVGIVWQGSPGHRADSQRSVPLAAFAPLARVPGVRLVSLQKEFGSEQVDQHPELEILDFGDELDADAAFVDSAALMQCLDLVVTTDTACAHLAGALGVPVWVALSLAPDWRWLLEREDSPWYPSMRLFRQTKLGEWSPVFERIAAELRRQVALSGRAACSAVRIEVAPGELIDKITILEIKSERIADEAARANILKELASLSASRDHSILPSHRLQELTRALKQVNEALWEIEDDIRQCERQQDFGEQFVQLARSVYHLNDRRAALKREINQLLQSDLMEEKSYQPY